MPLAHCCNVLFANTAGDTYLNNSLFGLEKQVMEMFLFCQIWPDNQSTKCYKEQTVRKWCKGATRTSERQGNQSKYKNAGLLVEELDEYCNHFPIIYFKK